MKLGNKIGVIYLVRHGHIQIRNGERCYVGHIDVPLSAEGRRQAQLLQKRLVGRNISAIICSDLTRSVDTANIIAAGLDKKVTVRADLREISMGSWEGISLAEIARRFPAQYKARGENITGYRVPGGESFVECQTRVIAAFNEVVQSAVGSMVIVGHAGVNRLLLCHVLGLPLKNLFRLAQDYGCINIVKYDQGQYQVKLVNG